MPRPTSSSHDGSPWVARIIPTLIIGIFALATYAVVGRLCSKFPNATRIASLRALADHCPVDYLYKQKGRSGIVTAFLTLYFLFFLLTVATYLRTFVAVQRNPGLVPLPPDVQAEREAIEKKKRRARKPRRRRETDVEAQAWAPPDQDPDSAGLEAFYSKDVFVCEVDGRPKWCPECRRWKPDRAHHSSDLGRCVRKMDHFCPWVGGMVSETSFNFFAQFTFYCTFFCAVCLAIGAYCLKQRSRDQAPLDGWMVAAVVLSCFFGGFACAMLLTSLRFILTNITNIDTLKKAHSINLAVRIPSATPPTDKYPTIVYPLRADGPRPPAQPGQGQHHQQQQHQQHQQQQQQQQKQPYKPANGSGPALARDKQAERKFAILRTQPRENPWNLGPWENWKSVMGDNFVEWLLPIRHSPCCNHESMTSDYEYGPLVSKLRERYGVPDLHGSRDREEAIELHDRRTRARH